MVEGIRDPCWSRAERVLHHHRAVKAFGIHPSLLIWSISDLGAVSRQGVWGWLEDGSGWAW
jgi:hypothetical protein